MDILTAIAILVPSTLSLITSMIYAYIALKKLKEPSKDEIWETATKLLCNSNSSKDADDFAILYEELRLFKENGCSLKDIDTLAYEVRARHRQGSQKLSEKN